MGGSDSGSRSGLIRGFSSGLSVRARLLLAFTVLSFSAMTLAIVGWLGLSNTEAAFQQFEQRALPDIARSLELAERTANLAAVAPYVASASGPFMLQGENKLLREKIDRVLQLAGSLPELEAAAPNLQNLLVRLDKTIDELIELTRSQLFLREDIRQYNYRLGILDGFSVADQFERNSDPTIALSEPAITITARLQDLFNRHATF